MCRSSVDSFTCGLDLDILMQLGGMFVKKKIIPNVK